MRKRIPIEKEKLLRNSLVADFTIDNIDRFADKVARGRFPMKGHEVYVPDHKVRGLKASVMRSGNWSFTVEYRAMGEPGRRPYMVIGKPPEMTVEQAREIGRAVFELRDRPGMTIEEARSIIDTIVENVTNAG